MGRLCRGSWYGVPGTDTQALHDSIMRMATLFRHWAEHWPPHGAKTTSLCLRQPRQQQPKRWQTCATSVRRTWCDHLLRYLMCLQLLRLRRASSPSAPPLQMPHRLRCCSVSHPYDCPLSELSLLKYPVVRCLAAAAVADGQWGAASVSCLDLTHDHAVSAERPCAGSNARAQQVKQVAAFNNMP